MPVRLVDELAKVDREALALLATAKIAGQKVEKPTLWQVGPESILFSCESHKGAFTAWKGGTPAKVVRVDEGFVAEF